MLSHQGEGKSRLRRLRVRVGVRARARASEAMGSRVWRAKSELKSCSQAKGL